MEAARAARLAGHEVTLYEKDNHLGGQFTISAIPPTKGDITLYLSWIARQLEKLGVSIKLNTEYSLEIFEKEKPDLVIIATGSYPSRPAIPGLDGKNVVVAQDVLTGKASTGQKVVVAGGGMIGSETATYIASLGKKVTIVEMLPAIATDEEFTRRVLLMKMIGEKCIGVVTDAKITGIDEKGVQIEKKQCSMNIEADTVVLALGMTPDTGLVKELEGKVRLKIVGDAMEVRNALEATREGFLAGAEA